VPRPIYTLLAGPKLVKNTLHNCKQLYLTHLLMMIWSDWLSCQKRRKII